MSLLRSLFFGYYHVSGSERSLDSNRFHFVLSSLRGWEFDVEMVLEMNVWEDGVVKG